MQVMWKTGYRSSKRVEAGVVAERTLAAKFVEIT